MPPRKTKWIKELLADPKPLAILDMHSANRHRKESFKTAVKLLGTPSNVVELCYLADEYVRQLVGPEVYDVYWGKHMIEGETDVRTVFNIIRKSATGA